MRSVLRSVRKRKKSRRLGEVDIIRREEYAGFDVDAKVEMIRALVPLGLMHVGCSMTRSRSCRCSSCAQRVVGAGTTSQPRDGAPQRVPLRVRASVAGGDPCVPTRRRGRTAR